MRVKQHSARAATRRCAVHVPVIEPCPAFVAEFGYLSRTYNETGNLVRAKLPATMRRQA